MTRGVKGDCAAFEQRILQGRDTAVPAGDPAVAAHLRECEACRALWSDLRAIRESLDAFGVREPSEALLLRVEDQALRFAARAAAEPAGPRARTGITRLVAAGLAALPIVVLINAVMGWGLYELLSLALPRPVAWYGVGLFALWASLGVSLSYASLPFLSLLPGGGASPRVPLPSGARGAGMD